MEEIGSYLTLARTATLAEFVAKMETLFLIKRPTKRTSVGLVAPPISYATQLTKLEGDPFPAEWRIVAVKKREGNPYPDRISIGRALNCDVVLLLPTVSKVHAHIQLEGPSAFTLRDNDASNFTFVNGRKLEPKSASKVKIGDEISFGTLDLEFIDSQRLYGILKSEVGATR
jgi:hypothetical protein